MTGAPERLIEISPAYDKRDKGHGTHCCELRMILKGQKGAVQFVMFTGWFPKSIDKEKVHTLYPMAADVGRHSLKPMYKDEPVCRQKCEYLDDRPCYYDGSSLNAIPVMQLLIDKGSDAVWEYLEGRYKEYFCEGE